MKIQNNKGDRPSQTYRNQRTRSDQRHEQPRRSTRPHSSIEAQSTSTLLDILLEVANDIASGIVLADEIPALGTLAIVVVAFDRATADFRRLLPDQLGEVARLLAEFGFAVVVFALLARPSVDGEVGGWVALGEVLAVVAALDLVLATCCCKGGLVDVRSAPIYIALRISARRKPAHRPILTARLDNARDRNSCY